MGCRPYMCDTSSQHSNCFDQYRKPRENCRNMSSEGIEVYVDHRQVEVSGTRARASFDVANLDGPRRMGRNLSGSRISRSGESAISHNRRALHGFLDLQADRNRDVVRDIVVTEWETSSINLRHDRSGTTEILVNDSVELKCPLCRGEVRGWQITEASRKYLNSKLRSFSYESCSFSGTYKDLRKHARNVHPTVRPVDVDASRPYSMLGLGDIVIPVLSVAPLVVNVNPNLNVVLTACLTVYVGCYHPVKPAPPSETMSKEHAMHFPLIGSVVLVSLFILFKFLSKDLVNAILTSYFFVLGIIALSTTLLPAIERFLPNKWNESPINCHLPYFKSVEVEFTKSQLVAAIPGTFFCTWYALKKHWLANNVLGLAFCIQGIEMLSLGSFKTGAILLARLFVYDIFGVFFTPVMVSVAKSFDAPIKLLFPTTDVNPARQHAWRDSESSREFEDMLSTIRSAMPMRLCLGIMLLIMKMEFMLTRMRIVTPCQLPLEAGGLDSFLFHMFGPIATLTNGRRFSARWRAPRKQRNTAEILSRQFILWGENRVDNDDEELDNASVFNSDTKS